MDGENLYGAVWKRRSVRKFLDSQVEEEKADILRERISEVNGRSGLTIEFIESGDAFRSVKTLGRFRNVRSVMVFKGRTDDPDLFEKCGYYGEELILTATGLGLGTCWVAATFNKKSESLNVKSGEKVVCVSPVGYGSESISETAQIPAEPHRRTISASKFLSGIGDVPPWVSEGIRSVQFAPTAMNSQKARFRYADGELSVEMPRGDLNMVDLGITKLHFELAANGRFPLGTPSRFVTDR
ncbi:MAG: nitroreductase family protein [Candidatus Methanoplasma sp.]|jgi:nitroreductase|nr:nitroreductase family protein [Candidatus Methanoplasma sp.]